MAAIIYKRFQTLLLPKTRYVFTAKTMGLPRFAMQSSTINGYAKSFCNGFSTEDYFCPRQVKSPTCLQLLEVSVSKENTCQGGSPEKACKTWHCFLHWKQTSSLGNQKTGVVPSLQISNYIYEQNFNFIFKTIKIRRERIIHTFHQRKGRIQ